MKHHNATPDLFDAQVSRETGISQAIEHAEAVEPDWREAALKWVERFCDARQDARFLTEDVRQFAYQACGFCAPTDGRAWGQIMRDAERLGIVVKAGTLPARSSNLSPKIAWRKAR